MNLLQTVKASQKEILFVSHDASKSGAPIVLLTFLNWLQKNTNTNITLLLKKSGELFNEFSETGLTYCWAPKTAKPLKYDLISRAKRKIKSENPFLPFPVDLEKEKFDLIYLNTVVSLDLASFLKEKFQCPVIAHIHEMEYSVNAEFSTFLSEQNKKAIDHYVAVSKDVKNNLVQNHAINSDDISLIYEFVDVNKIKAQVKNASSLKKELGLKNEFIVGGCGFSTWRKGIDLFIYTAAYIKRNYPEEKIKFIWVGLMEEVFKERIKYELIRLGVEHDIIFTGPQANAPAYFQLYDLFLLTSREDPFPLVCLEAAALKKPIVCFKQSGGMNEFIERGGGLSVDYGNIEQLASTIIQLKNNKAALNLLGEAAEQSSRCYDVNVIAPKLYSIMNEVMITNHE